MAKYIAKRIGFSILTILVLVTVTFFLMHLLPGDPFIGEKPINEATRKALYARYGLDQPLIVQYLKYVGNALRGDFGNSMVYQNKKVADIIGAAFPYSFELGLRALVWSLICGLLLGIVAALHHGRGWDRAATIIAVIGISVPSFILGALLQYFLGVLLSGWTQTHFGFRAVPVSGWETERDKILPAFVLGFGTLASISRMMRSSLLDVMGMDYIKTARSKGLNRREIVSRHMIRNAITPVLTILGPLTASLLTGAFVVENIFNIPGLGKYYISSIQSNDYTMIAGTTLFYGTFIVIANFIVDILIVLVNPTVRLGGKGGKKA